MKPLNMIIFLSIVLSVNYSINYYIIRRGLDVIPQNSPYRLAFIIIVLFLASAFLLGRTIERFSINIFSEILIWAGSIWMAFMVYFLLQLVLIDLFRLLNHFFGIFPEFLTQNIQRAKNITAIIVVSISTITVLFGFINTKILAQKNFEFSINKKAGKLNELNIAALSDIHLGTIIGRSHLSKIVEKVNETNPDIILIPGDIIDEDIGPVIKNNVGEILTGLKAKYGVYAVTGNHEYIGGVSAAKKYLAEHNINLLNDEHILIDSSFYLIGREDLSIAQFTSQRRKPLSEIVENVDKTFPLILLDHQPFKLEQAVDNGIDLQLSGHTHHGQLYPFNYITNMVYELSWGYKKKGNTHIYVSCGAGGWGPPIRTNSRPEIVNIKLHFVNN